jgi:outer membrane protein TolC
VFTVPFSVSYELDLFGRVRRNLEAANASLQGSAADLENVRLVLTAELAADYFNLRESDREAGVVRQSVEIQQRGLDLVNHRHEGGVANGLEVAQQAALLDSTATPSPCFWGSLRRLSAWLRRLSSLPLRRFPPQFHPRFWSAGLTSQPVNARWHSKMRKSASR